MGFFKLFGAVLHSAAHPDTAFVTVSFVGYKGLVMYLMVMGISSLATIAFFWGNRIFISGAGSRLSFLVKLRDFSNRKVQKVGFFGFACSLVRKSRYFGLAVASFIPIVVGARESSLFAAQALDMTYALPVVLLANGIRLYLLFVFGPAIWQIGINYLFHFFQLAKGLII